MTIGLQIFLPPRPDVAASYALRVPQAGDLLTASFRPHLMVTALAVQLTVPVIRVRRGLPPPSECALPGAHEKGDSGIFQNLLLYPGGPSGVRTRVFAVRARPPAIYVLLKSGV